MKTKKTLKSEIEDLTKKMHAARTEEEAGKIWDERVVLVQMLHDLEK